MSAITEQKCPCCGGAVEFDVSSQKLKCPYCGTEFDISAMQEAEQNSAAANAADSINWSSQNAGWSAGETDGMSVYGCNSCGGEIVADATTGATNCPYCGNQVIMKGQFSGALRPDLVIPFKLDKKAAKEALKKHISTKKFVPKLFKSENRLEEIKGVYVPHWLFSGDAVANAGFKATKTMRWSDSNNNYTKTAYFDVYRSGNVRFENIPVDGSSKMPDDLMESIEPFNVNDAVPFNTAYLAGYLADKYDVSVDNSYGRANERIKNSAASALKNTVDGYDFVNLNNINMNIANGNYKYALYPVWILASKWNGKNYTFAMNGQTGKMTGDIPTDNKAVLAASAIAGAAIGAVLYGILWLIALL